jgi:hypothetical protein
MNLKDVPDGEGLAGHDDGPQENTVFTRHLNPKKKMPDNCRTLSDTAQTLTGYIISLSLR